MIRNRATIGALAVTGGLLLAGCASSTPTASQPTASVATPSSAPAASTKTSPPVPVQSPVPVESNPPGDIPDNTAFVPYRSVPGGFRLTVPEGWARSNTKSSVAFSDKLNSITTSWAPATTAPTVASGKATDVPQLKTTEPAFRLKSITKATLPAGPAVLITYEANSKPNAVTGKQYRLVVLRYELFRGGQETVLSLGSPVGADNVDPWNTVTRSFAWA